jgi:uncharacterized membrane protein YjfL (UPF0719 family)
MDSVVYFKFLGNSLLFTSVITLIGFISGWILYSRIVLRGINLRDSLFEKDNLAAWLEFIGAFIFPAIYLSAKAVEGSASESLWLDLVICIAYALAYIVLFTLLRLISGLLVSVINANDENGKINLNKEIYEQKNVAAALFSITLSYVFTNIARYLDVMPDYILASLLRMLIVLVFMLAVLLIYSIVLRRKTTLYKEIFIDNNPAAGIGFLGFVYASGLILNEVIAANPEFDFLPIALTAFIGLIVFAVVVVVFKYIFAKLVKVDLWKEVYEQNNIGAAFGLAGLYAGVAFIIIHFMR